MSLPAAQLGTEGRFRGILEQLPVVVYVDRLDDVSTAVYMSPPIEDLTGYAPEEFERDPGLFLALVHPDDRERYLQMIDERNRTGVAASGEYRLVTRDGRTVWVFDQERIVVDDHRRPLYAQGYLVDTTARRTDRVRLEAINVVLTAFSEGTGLDEVIRRALETIAAAIPGIRASYLELHADGQLHVRASTPHPTIADNVHHAGDPSAAPDFLAALERGDPVEVADTWAETRYGAVVESVRALGVSAFLDVPLLVGGRLAGVLCLDSATARSFDDGEVLALREVVRQLGVVLERDRAARDLQRRDDILSSVSGAAAAVLAGVSWEDAAPGLLRSLGEAAGTSRAYIFETATRADGTSVASQRFEWCAPEVTPELDNPAMQDMPFSAVGLESLAEAVARNEVFAGHVRTFPAEARELLEPQGILSIMTVPIVVDGALWGFVGFDECERERAWSAAETDALRTAASLLAAAIRRQRNERALREQKHTLRAVFDASFDAILITDEAQRLVDVNPAAEELFGVGREQIVGRAAAEFVPVDQRDALAAARRELDANDWFAGELPMRRSDGAVRDVEISARRDFVPGLNISFVRDVTERKRMEAQLLQSQRLESMGRLAGGIAHDFNNLLTAISGYTSLLLDRPATDPDLMGDLREVQRAADRAAELTRQLLAFGSRQVLQPRSLDLNEVVTGVESMLRRLIGEDIALTTRLERDLGAVLADPGQIEQVVVNLAVNARDAMPDGGKLTISTSAIERDGRACIALEVADNGVGMVEDTRSRIFEPFFTTRERGIGLGLASVYGIVTQSEGTIEVASQPGRGAIFTILLPRMDSPAAAPAATAVAARPQGSGTVLLVEDEDVVRALARRVLEEHGYAVLESCNGHEAIGIAETHEGEIALVLTDVVMPGLRGHEVADRVAASRPGIRVLYMSGYADEALLGRAADGKSDFLEKPFSNDALAQKVREALAR